MELRQLGGTGLGVSPLGLGTVKLGRTRGLKYATSGMPSDEQAGELLRRAGELGINLIDTAPAYGTSEERLGKLLAGDRERWVISTKAGEEFDGERSTFDFSPEAITRSVERSLVRLRTDRVEIVLLHSDGVGEARFARDGSFDALRRLKERGLVRAIGASTKTPAGAMLAVGECDVVMVTLNQDDDEAAPAVAEAARRGVGVLVKKALRSGKLGLRGEEDPVQSAMKWVFAHRGVTSVVVGTTSVTNLAHNASCAAACAERAAR